MATQNTQKGSCAYCGVYGEITEDHVIPRGFFGKPTPGDIPRVPACPTCNNKVKSADDNYVRDIMAADMSHAGHPIARANFEKMQRSAEGGHSTLAKAFPQAQLTELHSPGGIYVGRAYQVPIDQKRVQRFMITTTRGLYCHHFKMSLPADELYYVNFQPDPEKVKFLINGFVDARAPLIAVGNGDVFEYFYGMSPSDPLVSYWLFNFYHHSVWSVGTRGPNSAMSAPLGASGVTADEA